MPQQAKKNEQNDQTEIWMSALDAALPLYTRAHFSKLKACVEDVKAGRDLSLTVEGKSAKWVCFAADAALRAGKVADEALMADSEDLAAMPFEGLDDFSLITLAQVLFDRDPGPKNRELSDKTDKRNAEALQRVLFSDEGNPLVDYNWIAIDLVQYQHVTEDIDEFDILKMSLAHTLRYGDETEVMPVLRHIGALHLECGEIADGCLIYGELITSDPLDFENYYDVSLLLSNLKHYDLSIKAADRARHMLRISKTDNEMADDLAFSAEMTRKHASMEEAGIDKLAEAPLRKALETGFMRGTHLPIDELAVRIVPELDCIPVKQMPRF